MGWTHGALRSFGGFAGRQMAQYFPATAANDYSSIVTSGGGVVAQASGGTGCAMRMTKTSAAGTGWRYIAGGDARNPDTGASAGQHLSITHHIHFRSNAGASGIAAGNTIVFYSWIASAATLGEPGIKNVGTNDGAGRDLRLIIADGVGGITWQSSYTMVVDTDYQIQFRVYTPQPGVGNVNWRHQIILRSQDGTERDRSPVIQVNQNGTSVQEGASTISPGFGIAGPGGASTTDTPDYVVNAYCFVTNGAWSPDTVKCGMNGAATASGTAGRNQWLLTAGASKPAAVDPSADLDDTTYIQSTSSTEAIQMFTHAGSNITLAGAEEIFAPRVVALVKVVSGGGSVQCSIYNGLGQQSDLNGTGNSASYAWTFTRPSPRSATTTSFNLGGDSGAPWVVGGGGTNDVNALEFGVTRLLGSGTQDKRCTGCVLEILYGIPASDAFNSNHTTRVKNHTTSTRRTMPAERTP